MRFLIKPDNQFGDLSDSRPPAGLDDAEVPFGNNQIITVIIKQKYGQIFKDQNVKQSNALSRFMASTFSISKSLFPHRVTSRNAPQIRLSCALFILFFIFGVGT